MFDINYFTQDPRPFFRFARDIYPGKFQPSPCHRFIKLLEKHKKLLRNYTQNIDTLEREAAIERVVECHGSFATATCTKCGNRVSADVVREDILEQRIPLCSICQTMDANGTQKNGNGSGSATNGGDYRELVARGIMKPDIVFFGEGLPEQFHDAMTEDKTRCDLLLVIGSSLKVRPVALIPLSVYPNVPQILINREPLPHYNFDVELLGDCDVIVHQLCHLLGESWTSEMNQMTEPLQESTTLEPLPESLDNISAIFNPETEPERSGAEPEPSESNSNNQQEVEIDTEGGEYLDLKHIKERHISVDSAKDSGIGDSSNSGDMYRKYEEKSFWSAKMEKRSLAERLPTKSFYFVPPCRYIFPGAEVYSDQEDDKFGGLGSDMSDSDSSDSDSDTEDEGKMEIAERFDGEMAVSDGCEAVMDH